jgi:RNA polymerase sigma-70 factor (ECF subfamily)
MTSPRRHPAPTAELPANDVSLPAASVRIDRDILALCPFLRGRAQFLTQDPIAAEDLVQDTLEKALVARVHFRVGTNLKAWLGAIMRHVFIDGRRRDGVHRRRTRELSHEPRQPPPAEEPDPRDLVSLADVVRSLETLSAADREIFAMFYLQRRSYQEIRADLGLRSATIGVKLLRAKRKVRELLMHLVEARTAALPTSTII